MPTIDTQFSSKDGRTLSVAVVDDHPFIAKGLEAILGSLDRISLMWSATSVHEATTRFAEEPVDIALVDVKLGETNGGLEVLKYLSENSPETKPLVLSAFASPRVVREAAKFGAVGFFSKTNGSNRLVQAIELLRDGGTPSFLGDYQKWASPNPVLDISPRERDVLLELSRGRSNSEMAELLGLKVGTIKTHLESIYRKLDVSNRTDAVVEALAQGYFQLEEITKR